MVVRSVGEKTFELAENPLWLKSEKAFFWVDIEQGKLYRYCLDTAIVECILSTQYRIGAFVFDCDDNLILLTEKGLIRACKKDNDYLLESKFIFNYPLENERFNDAICDESGRIIAGIKMDDNSSNGRLVVFERNKNPRILINNIKISNGMGFSTNNEFFYHIDSLEKEIYKYCYNLIDGTISEKKVIYKNNGLGVPDGMTIDANNNILTCIWGEGKLLKIKTDEGIIDNNISLPCKLCSSLTFGGINLNKILVTSAYISLDEDVKTEFDGAIYLIDDLDYGKIEYKAKV